MKALRPFILILMTLFILGCDANSLFLTGYPQASQVVTTTYKEQLQRHDVNAISFYCGEGYVGVLSYRHAGHPMIPAARDIPCSSPNTRILYIKTRMFDDGYSVSSLEFYDMHLITGLVDLVLKDLKQRTNKL